LPQGVAFSPDGRNIASGSDTTTIKIWDISTGQEIRTLSGDRQSSFSHLGEAEVLSFFGSVITSVAFSPDGRNLASGSMGGTIAIWDASTGQKIRAVGARFRGPPSPVMSMAFSPDGRIIASNSMMGIELWDASTGQKIRAVGALSRRPSPAISVAFSPDGGNIASGSDDKTIKIWDTSTGQEIRRLSGHGARVQSVAFSPDGRRIASGSQDGTIKIWDVSTSQEIRTLLPGG
jgi:WD40 repeat protein